MAKCKGERSGKSRLVVKLATQIREAGLPAPVREHLFALAALGRRWRFDFAWPGERVAAEVEGGTWTRGRHVRGLGYEGDCTKYNAAQNLGWIVLRFTGGMLERKEAVPALREALTRRGYRITEQKGGTDEV